LRGVIYPVFEFRGVFRLLEKFRGKMDFFLIYIILSYAI